MSCNPVKTVLKSDDKVRQVFEAGVRKGWCVNESSTVVETRDSIVYKDSIIERIERIPCEDFDTTIGKSRIRVSSGVLTFSTKDSVVYRVKTVKETVRDRSLENILKKDIVDREDKILGLRKEVADLNDDKSNLRKTLNKWKARFFGLLVIIGLIIGARIYLKKYAII